ncbi:hypothetical protein ACP6L2_04245 [Sphingobacterium lactis]|uniref:hypothetical protein n=1 Tax=Sphingobacterium lactis TaxID=797291 RepID=UPI003F7E2FFC
MKKIFISYADENMAYSLRRIGKQAKSLKMFDDIILWRPNDLPSYIRESELMQFKRGGGYWAWKPVIIAETLKRYSEDCMVVYCDAGCSLQKSDDWNRYFNLIKEKDTICFEYNDTMEVWSKFGQTSSKIKYWTKGLTINFFNNLLQDENYSEKYNKIWGGLMICKGLNNNFINKWLELTLKYPELVMDNHEKDADYKNSELSFHKHDQSLITPLAHFYSDEVMILPKNFDTINQAAVLPTRYRARTFKDGILIDFKSAMRRIFGNNLIGKIKSILK